MIKEVHAILHDWDGVRCEDNGAYWLVSGSYQGQPHAGTREDPVSLARDLAVIAGSPVAVVEPEPEPEPVASETDALRERIAELEALVVKLTPVEPDPAEPPAEALLEAYPDEDHAALKARIMAEFASLRNALVGHIPMTMEQLARLQALEHPKFQTWLQG